MNKAEQIATIFIKKLGEVTVFDEEYLITEDDFMRISMDRNDLNMSTTYRYIKHRKGGEINESG
jgi:hypothetical protein